MNITKMSVLELMQAHEAIINELKRRGIARTQNKPIGDLTEYIVSKAYRLTLCNNSKCGYDGISSSGERVQIKSRKISKGKVIQLGAIRNLKDREFDTLVAIIYDDRYNITMAKVIPYDIVSKYARHRNHDKSDILYLRGPILEEKAVKDVTQKMTKLFSEI